MLSKIHENMFLKMLRSSTLTKHSNRLEMVTLCQSRSNERVKCMQLRCQSAPRLQKKITVHVCYKKASRLLPVYKMFLPKSGVDFPFVFPAAFFLLFSFLLLSLFYFIYRDLSYNEIEHLPQSCCNGSNIL